MVKLKDSVGNIAASSVIPYPPGVPIIVPGEVMTEDILESIFFLKENDINFVGLNGDEQDYMVVVE